MKIGARTIKTTLAIYLSLVIPSLLGIPETADLAMFAAVFSMLPSVRESYMYILNRMLANTLGGIIAVFVSIYLGKTPLMIAFAALILIATLHSLHLNDMIGLAVSTLVIIMLADGNQVTAAFNRVLATIIGVLIAFLVNALILPPNYDIRFYNLTLKTTDEMNKFLRAILRKNTQYVIMRSDLKEIRELVDKLNLYFKYMCDPMVSHFNRKKRYSHLRKLAVSRQSLRSSEALYSLTLLLQKSEDTLNHMPIEMRALIRERLETLMTAHEQILLKWSGRVLPDEVNFFDYKSDLRISFMESLYSEASSDEVMQQADYVKSNTLISIMAKIFEYDEALSQLNTLMSSFMRSSNYQEDFSDHFHE